MTLTKLKGTLLSKPTLTMGCIECHDKKEITNGPISTKDGYYDEIHKRLLNNDKNYTRSILKIIR